jgi:hypothetical protein
MHVDPLQSNGPRTATGLRCFMCGPCRDVISRTVSESQLSGVKQLVDERLS